MKTKIYRLGRAEFLVYRRSRRSKAATRCRIKQRLGPLRCGSFARHDGQGYPTAAKVVQRHGEYSTTIATILDAHAQSKAKKQS